MTRKQRADEPTVCCPLCGMAVQRLDVHRIRCQDMPTPVEMAAHYLADSQVTLLTLASCYRVAVKVIRERLEFGLNALGTNGIMCKKRGARSRGFSAVHALSRTAVNAPLARCY